MTTPILCESCEQQLSADELDGPHEEDGEILCDECWHERYEFTCCGCAEYGHVRDQHNMLVVFEPVHSICGPDPETAPGIYRIVGDGPYHCHPMIGEGWLYASKLARISDLLPGMEANDYPCGHLCADCQAIVLAQYPAKCAGCRQHSPACLRVRLGSWQDFEANKYQWSRPKVLCPQCRKAHRGAWKVAERTRL